MLWISWWRRLNCTVAGKTFHPLFEWQKISFSRLRCKFRSSSLALRGHVKFLAIYILTSCCARDYFSPPTCKGSLSCRSVFRNESHRPPSLASFAPFIRKDEGSSLSVFFSFPQRETLLPLIYCKPSMSVLPSFSGPRL